MMLAMVLLSVEMSIAAQVAEGVDALGGTLYGVGRVSLAGE